MTNSYSSSQLVKFTLIINYCRSGGDPMLEPMNNPNIRVGAD